MYLEITCPVCNRIQSLQLDQVGQSHACSGCRSTLRVPEPGQPATRLETPGGDDGSRCTTPKDSATSSELRSKPSTDPEGLNVLSGIGLIAIGCGQLFYSFLLVMKLLFAASVGVGKVSIVLLLAAFAIVPDDTSGLLNSAEHAHTNVFLVTIIVGPVLAIAAIGIGFIVCRTPGQGQMGTLVVAGGTAFLCLLHLVNGLALIAFCYFLATLLAGSYFVRSGEQKHCSVSELPNDSF